MSDSVSDKSLVLVVGAGASFEVNLPVGRELKKQIASALNFKEDFTRPSGDGLIKDALKQIAFKEPYKQNMVPLLDASRRIRDGMPLAISIDNFIDANRSSKEIEIAGKLAIVRCILEAESKSKLFVDLSNINNTIDFQSLEKSWFNSFFQILTENCQQADLCERFAKIAIICFNYDRCIEHYLYHALKTYYGMSSIDAANVMNKLDIYHPYGMVGNLDWQEGQIKIGFGQEPDKYLLIELAYQIRTFTEGTDVENSNIEAIRSTISTANLVAFLGFAFHSLNIKLLFPGLKDGDSARNHPIYATALGISQTDIEKITKELSSYGTAHYHNIRLDSSLTCADFFNEFWRSLAIE